MDGAAEDDIQNPYDRMADIAARRRAAEEERLSQRRLNQILTGTANQFVLWRHYNLRRYYNLGLRIREKVHAVYRSKTTLGEREEFHERMLDGSLIEEAISEIRLEQILTGTADQSILGEQYNLGDLTKEKVYDVYKSLTTPEEWERFHYRMRDGSIIASLRDGDNMHTSGMLENTKRRRARLRASAAAAATGSSDHFYAASAPQGNPRATTITDTLPERPMDEIFRIVTGTTRPVSYGGPPPSSSGGMVRKTRKHKRRTKRKRNTKHTYRRHSKSSKRK